MKVVSVARLISVLFASSILFSCSDTKDLVKKDELKGMEQSVLAQMEQKFLQLRQDMTKMSGELVSVEQLKAKVEGLVKDVSDLIKEHKALHASLGNAGAKMREDLIKTLKLEQKILGERLRNFELLIEELEKAEAAK